MKSICDSNFAGKEIYTHFAYFARLYFYAFYSISQPNYAILVILRCSFQLCQCDHTCIIYYQSHLIRSGRTAPSCSKRCSNIKQGVLSKRIGCAASNRIWYKNTPNLVTLSCADKISFCSGQNLVYIGNCGGRTQKNMLLIPLSDPAGVGD